MEKGTQAARPASQLLTVQRWFVLLSQQKIILSGEGMDPAKQDAYSPL